MGTWGQFLTHFDLWEPLLTQIFVLGFSYISLGGVYILYFSLSYILMFMALWLFI